MSDLTTTHDDLPERKITPVLSPDLKSLLVDETDSWSVRRIHEDPELRAEAIANLPVLRAAARQKAGRAGVMEVIGKRFALYPQPNRSEGEWAAWWSDYVEVLGDIPWHSLEAGMAAYVADPKSEFMPKPGKLRELALTTPARVAVAYERANKVAELNRPRPVYAEPTEEERKASQARADAEHAEIRKMADDLLKTFKVKTLGEPAQRSSLPSTAGKPDEGGLTPAMRALLAKREAQA